jgi:hypothetical protein
MTTYSLFTHSGDRRRQLLVRVSGEECVEITERDQSLPGDEGDVWYEDTWLLTEQIDDTDITGRHLSRWIDDAEERTQERVRRMFAEAGEGRRGLAD